MPAPRAPVTVVILAAGQGTRMRSDTIKLLHPVAGRPMVELVAECARALKPRRTVAVVGFQAERVRAALERHVDGFAEQREQRGTGHAVLQAAGQLPKRGTVLIVNGDLPTLRGATLRKLVEHHRRRKAAMTLLTARIAEPTGYGRIVRAGGARDGALERIVEHGDADAAVRRIDEINCGIYCVEAHSLLPALEALRPDNAQGEYYLPDVAHRLLADGRTVNVVLHDDADEVLGVNTRAELARASHTLYGRKATELQVRGVTLLDASRTWIDPRATIGRDTTIWPDVVVEGPCAIGAGCTIRSGSRIADSRLGRGVTVLDHCVMTDARVGNGASVGPFAHLRPGTELGAETKVGNFVELKKSKLGRGSKASHLSYIGDATVGTDCNIGAGTITCNYDGVSKNRTTIGRRVFIGSDSQLVAPVTIRDGAYVGAGTTVTKDVPAGALAIGRARQKNIEGWSARKKKARKKSG